MSENLQEVILDILRGELPSQDALLDKLFEGEISPEMYQPMADVFLRTDGVFDFQTRLKVLESIENVPEEICTAFAIVFMNEQVEGIPLAEILKGFRNRVRALVPSFMARTAPPEILGALRGNVRNLTKDQHHHLMVELGADVLLHAETNEDSAEATPDIIANEIVFGNEHAQRLRSAYELYRALRQRQNFVLDSRPNGRPIYSLHNMYAIADRAAAYIGASQLPPNDLKPFRAHISALDRFLVKVVDFQKKKAILTRRAQARQGDDVLGYLPRILEIQIAAKERLDLSHEGLIRDLNEQAGEVAGDLKDMLTRAITLEVPEEAIVQRLLLQNGFLHSLWGESQSESEKTHQKENQKKDESLSPRTILILTAEHFARNCDGYVAEANDWLLVHKSEVPRKKLEKFVNGIGDEEDKATRFYAVAEAMQQDFDEIIAEKCFEIVEEMFNGNRTSEPRFRQLQQIQAAKKGDARKMALSWGFISEEQFYAFSLLERVGGTTANP